MYPLLELHYSFTFYSFSTNIQSLSESPPAEREASGSPPQGGLVTSESPFGLIRCNRQGPDPTVLFMRLLFTDVLSYGVFHPNQLCLRNILRDQKCSPFTLFAFSTSDGFVPHFSLSKNLFADATLYFGGYSSTCGCGLGIRCPSTIFKLPFAAQFLQYLPNFSLRNLPYSFFFRYLGTITTWYLQSHLTCDRLCQSCIGSSSATAPLRAFPDERTYFISHRNGRTFPGPPPEVEDLDRY